ncbi:MAG: MBL fold metallo-hydrolase [Myxococcales bacterium]|nr:MBL fold metallo-hydrolase [Myxococcales bacterium]
MTRVLCVGTSDAFGSGGRRQSAYLVESPDGSMLLDCAATTLTGLEALGISRNTIDVIAVSHFHADHFAGVPQFLLATRFVDRRTRPLTVAGPPGVEERVRQAARAVGHPLDGEVEFPLRFHEFEAGREDKLGRLRLLPFATYHTPETSPHGLIVTAGGQRVAYSGDTGWFAELPAAVAGVDLFLCECTQEVTRYEYHLGFDELRAHHAEFECGRILLTHLGPQMRLRVSAEPFELVDDGMVIEL